MVNLRTGRPLPSPEAQDEFPDEKFRPVDPELMIRLKERFPSDVTAIQPTAPDAVAGAVARMKGHQDVIQFLEDLQKKDTSR